MKTASHPASEHDVEFSVKAQALLRLKLGFPVLALMVLAIWYWGPSSPTIGWMQIAAWLAIHTAYNFAALHFATRLRPFSAWEVVLATAILDPIMLSGWLALMGPPALVFVGFYLFTILGHGFRVGVVPMRICQCVTLAGFLLVVWVSPVWRGQPLTSLSHIVLLIVVPLYASMLIRKLHAARDHAERESQAKSQLLANVSHELRTPLTGIVSSAQLIEAETDDPLITERAASILKLSSALNTEINQLLDVAKHQARQIRPESAAFDLASVLQHLQLTLRPVAAVRNIEFAVQLDERVQQSVIGSAHELSSVLMNLAGNAIKFTEKGRADVRVDLIEDIDDEYLLRFSVQDTGIGIPPALQEKIFEPFYQVSTGAARRYGGTGLGTTIAKELVTLMGGTLYLESVPRRGSLFWFELRMVKAASVSAATPEEAPVRIVDAKHILVADDHATNLTLVKEMLKKDGHMVATANCGAEALECLNTMSFDAVFLDFHMADMDGAEVFELYRFGKVHTAPTFFITADTTVATTRRLLDLGAAGLLHKPITFEKLRAALAGQFQNEPAPDSQLQSPLHPLAPLKAVPVAYIDLQVLDVLREVSEAPEFLAKMLADGIADMERLSAELAPALENVDIEVVRFHAHALKGVSLSLGAVRLATLANRLMTVSAGELRHTKQQWRGDIEESIRLSVAGLRDVLAPQRPDRRSRSTGRPD